MESLLDFPWLSPTLGRALVAAAVLLIVRTLVLPSNRYNRNKIIRMGKSRLLTWLQWDTAPRLALDRYIAQGYSQVIKPLGKPFVITMCGMETTVLPEKYLPLLKGEDREKLSLCQGFENMFNMTATTGKVGRHDHVEIDIVAKYINPRLAQFLSRQVSQVDYVFQLNLGHANDWKKFNTFDLSSSLVYHLTAVVLVGEELCRDRDYIHAITEYSKSFLMSGFMWPVRPWGPFRDWGYWLGTWSLRRDINRVFKFLLPLIDRRIELLSSGDTKEKPMDMVQGLVESEVPSPEEGTPLRHAHRVLHITFAASAVSSALILHTLHQMLMTPEYLEPLRKEISKALDEHGGWNENAMLNMPFLDSYLREMLRLYPPSVLTGQRTILGDGFRFDDQLFLPAGSRIAFPTLLIHTDPNNYPDPLRFNPYRFMGKKTAGGGGESSSAFKIDNKYLSFGYGKQACPGRFLAVRQVKLILAKMIDGYDIRWAGETPKEVKYSVVEGQIFPDLTTQVCLKKRYAF